VNDDVKKEYRQENAKDAAVAGAVVGGSRQRQEKRQSSSSSSDAYNACMVGKGYSITQ